MSQNAFISGETLNLCVLNKDKHFKNLVKWVNREKITKYMTLTLPMPEHIEEDWFLRQGRDDKNIVLAIETKEGKHIGSVGLHGIDYISRTAEMGILIGDDKEWGKGYGSEAERLMTRYAFERLNLRKLHAKIMADNKGSLRAVEKNGAAKEGLLKEHVFCDNKYQDVVLLAFFRKDFYKNQ